MSKFAKGTHALGQCARSGRVMPLRDLVEDGQRPGMLVDPAYRDIPHPAEKPIDADDAVALRRAAPDLDDDSAGDSGESLAEAMGFTNSFGGET
jgi:hypothetical protein